MTDETTKPETAEAPPTWRVEFWTAVRNYVLACGGNPKVKDQELEVVAATLAPRIAAIRDIDELLMNIPGVEAQLLVDLLGHRMKSSAAIVAAVNLVEIAKRLIGGDVKPEEMEKAKESLAKISETLVRLSAAKV